MLKDGERLDDLELDGLRIIQHPDGYCFTSDSVILANSVKVKRTDRVVDLGTGSGIIATIIAAKFRPKEVIGLEIQPRLADMASRSVELNGLSDVIKIINAPVQGAEKLIGEGFDVVVTNPPYDDPTDGREEKDICRREILLNVHDTVASASRLLKFGGLFYMVNKARKLAEVLTEMRNNKLEPKRLLLIQPTADKDIDAFIVEGKKGAHTSMLVPKPIVVWESDGTMSEYVRRLYNK